MVRISTKIQSPLLAAISPSQGAVATATMQVPTLGLPLPAPPCRWRSEVDRLYPEVEESGCEQISPSLHLHTLPSPDLASPHWPAPSSWDQQGPGHGTGPAPHQMCPFLLHGVEEGRWHLWYVLDPLCLGMMLAGVVNPGCSVCCHTDPEVGCKNQVGHATTAPETATAALGHCEVQAAHCMMLCLTLLYC